MPDFYRPAVDILFAQCLGLFFKPGVRSRPGYAEPEWGYQPCRAGVRNLLRKGRMSQLSSYDLKELAQARTRGDRPGIFSVCSAHPWVLQAAMRRMAHEPGPLLIEATCNQVNQFGGYTGMTPADFRTFVERIAIEVRFPMERILLGGDHLGPYPWRRLPAQQAMEYGLQSRHRIRRCGFHEDPSGREHGMCDDPVPLPGDMIAGRAALLAGYGRSSCTRSSVALRCWHRGADAGRIDRGACRQRNESRRCRTIP